MRFDLHVLDGRLRGGHGAELCREILCADPWAKVIFYSGAAYEEDRATGLAAGAAEYVIKPDIRGLAAAAERLLPPPTGREK